MRDYLKTTGLLVWKDLRIESRTRELFLVMLVFALSILFILNFALDRNIRAGSESASGLIWMIVILAGQLGLNQTMGIEKNSGMLEALLVAPAHRSAIYLGKSISAFLSMFVITLIIHPVYSVLFNVPLRSPHFLWISLIGCWGYASLGVLISTMTIQTRTRDILLPVLFYPLIIPLAVSIIQASSASFAGEPLSSVSGAISQIIVFDLIFTAAGILGFETITED